jgi:hypothetical protein
MRPVLFSAGLGDVIRLCYLTRSHQHLTEARQPVQVLVASHNPFSMELFRVHRNAGNFVLYDLGHKYQEFLAQGLQGPMINRALCEFAGVDYAGLIREPASDYTPVFHAPDDIASCGHLVFQPFAGNNRYRALPPSWIEEVVQVLRRQPRRVFLVTRNYLRSPGKGGDGTLHDVEDARQWAGGNLTVLENLSVPATLNLVKSAAALICSFSSLCQAAWFQKVPVAVYYPPDCRDACGLPRSDYAFGIDREDCLARNFSETNPEELLAFLARF